jgi:hypothetical protein
MMQQRRSFAFHGGLRGRVAALVSVRVAGWLAGLILVAAAQADPRESEAGAAARQAAGAQEGRRLHEGRPGARKALWRLQQEKLAAGAWLLGGSSVGEYRATDAAASDGGGDVIEEARRALSRAGRVPWYDRQGDTVRRLAVAPQPPLSRAAASPAQPSRRTSSRAPQWLGTILQGVGLSVLVATLCLITVALVASFLRQEQQETAARKVISSRRDADRVASLPLPLDAAPADLLAEVRRLAAEGRFSQAIVYLFSYELLLLDQHQVLRLARGKTNRQYLREVRDRPALAAVLERTMQAFEAAFFGQKVIPPPTFAACWHDLEIFHAELAQLHPVAA